MELRSPIVLVLGAGFTKAFSNNAPLMLCDIDLPSLKKKFSHFDGAKNLLEQVKVYDNNIDVEQLLSRLYTGMPYDEKFIPNAERLILYTEIKKRFLDKIIPLKCDEEKKETLDKLAKKILLNNITCVTFNYDDILDESLYQSSKQLFEKEYEDRWDPDYGYGIYITPQKKLDGGKTYFSSENKRLNYLLKLHGSINWFPKKGYTEPYPLDAIIHSENWTQNNEDVHAAIKNHYSESHIIMPPVFDKSIISINPIFNVIWSLAFKSLVEASTVIFIGYSFPQTDFSVINLFKEALYKKTDKNIFIVNRGSSLEKQNNIKERYKYIFPDFSDKEFIFMDAYNWIETELLD